MSAGTTEMAAPSFAEVTPEQWQQLGGQRIFFGHQSVGANIIDGVKDVLAQHPNIPIQVIETSDPGSMQGPGLYHAPVGKNGEPSTKLAAFRDVVGAAGQAPATALLKYCYVDVTAATDPKALFEEYRQTVESMRAANPGLRVVHVTLPMLKDIGTVRYLGAVVRRLPTGRDVNLVRHQYNELLRQTYGGKEPIFDLARLESIKSDGNVAAVSYKGMTIPVLAAEWTYDGGHLNEPGRRRMAEAFLATLASL